MLVQNNPKLSDGGGETPESRGRGRQFDSGSEISSLPDGKLVMWSTASCSLALACRQSVSTKQQNNNIKPKICVPVVANFNPINQCVCCIRVVDIILNEEVPWKKFAIRVCMLLDL
jgi:hypothetical protein